MKRTLCFSLLSLFLVLSATSKAQDLKVKRVCFTDAFGEVWTFTDLHDNGDGTYSATGSVQYAYPSTSATLWVDTRNGLANASVEAHAVNNNPDGCNQYSDSFIYVGTAVINPGVSYSGSGDWTSYCFGSVLFTGTWDASGPCGTAPVRTNQQGTKPWQSKQQANNFSMQVSPNPVKNYTHVDYSLKTSSKVNITIYDYMHQPVAQLVNESKMPGKYSVSWNAINSSGTRVLPGLYKVVATVNGNVTSTTVQVQ